MPRYYFDIHDGQNFVDQNGSEWSGLKEARIEAVRYAAEVLKEMPERFWHAEQWRMSVSDHKRTLLFTLKFSAESAHAL